MKQLVGCYSQRVLYLHQINRCCVCVAVGACGTITGGTIHPLFQGEQNKWKHVIAKHGALELSDERARAKEKSFVRHTQFVMNYHTRDVLSWRKRHFSRWCCWYCALSRWQYGIRIRRGWKRTTRIHPSTLTLFHPLAKGVYTQFRKRCAREKHARGGIWQEHFLGTNPHTDWEGNRAKGKVLFGQIEQHQRLYPFHITAIVHKFITQTLSDNHKICHFMVLLV